MTGSARPSGDGTDVEPGEDRPGGQLADLVRHSAEGTVVIDEEGVILFANPAAEALLERPRGGVVGYCIGYPAIGSEPTTLALPRGSSDPLTVEVRAAPTTWDGEAAFVVNLRDVTEARRSDANLRRALGDLERAQAVAGIGSWRLDVVRNALEWSEENHRIFGVPPGTSLTYETFLSVVHPEDRDSVDAHWKAALEGAPYDIEHRLLVGGETRWVREKANLEFDPSGKLLGGIGITHDITDRKRSEAEQVALQARTQRLNRLLRVGAEISRTILRESDPGALIRRIRDRLMATGDLRGCWLVLTDGSAVVDATQEGMSDAELESLVARIEDGRAPPCCAVSPDPADVTTWEGCGLCGAVALDGALTAAIADGEGTRGFLTVFPRTASAVGGPWPSLLRNVANELAVALAHLGAAAGRERLLSLLEETERVGEIGGWEWDVRTDRLTVSTEWRRIHGVRQPSMQLTDLLALSHPDDRERWSSALRSLRDGHDGYDLTHRIVRPDTGEVRVVRARARRADHLVHGMSSDVTEQEGALERLRLHARMLESVGEAVIATDPAGTIVFWNRAAERMYGWEAEEVLGRPVLEVTPSPELAEQSSAILSALRRGETWSGELEVRRRDGSAFPALVTDAPVRSPDGTLEAIIGVSSDITEQKRAEEALRVASERLATAVRGGRVGLWEWNPVTDEATFSAEWKRQLGWRDEEVADDLAEWRDRVHPDELERVLAEIRGHLASGEDSYQVECRMRHRDGSYRSILSTASVVRDDEGAAVLVLGSHVDLTDLRSAEEARRRFELELDRARRMEAVGKLAGGVAHDFNNVLGVILGICELALVELDGADSRRSDFQEIGQAAERAANLTRQLLAFARRQVIAPKRMDVNEGVADALPLLRRLAGEDVVLVWRPAPDPSPVEMDPVQLDQVLTNLIVNARDAIRDTGTVTVELHNVEIDDLYCAETPEATPGPYVQLVVSDDGEGMDAETAGRIFEPFFTTKSRSGTGLGLATVHGIVRQNGGFINVYSEPETGTTFRLYWPRSPGGAGAEPRSADEPWEGFGGSETILVVEDDPAVLRILTRILERLGYDALVTDRPDEALALAEGRAEPIDLLLTDVVMPGMNGRDLCDRLAEFHPETRCLFMSGYTADVIAHRGVLDADITFLEKPFTTGTVARKIREALA